VTYIDARENQLTDGITISVVRSYQEQQHQFRHDVERYRVIV